MRCSEPGHRAAVAIKRLVGRVAELGSFGGERTPGAGSGRGGDPEILPDSLFSLIGADQISEDKRRLVVHRFDHEGRGFLFVYFEWFAATFPSAVARPAVTARGSVLA